MDTELEKIIGKLLKKEVKNKELWQQLDRLMSYHQVQWHWVKGHSGDPGNETADHQPTKELILSYDKKLIVLDTETTDLRLIKVTELLR